MFGKKMLVVSVASALLFSITGCSVLATQNDGQKVMDNPNSAPYNEVALEKIDYFKGMGAIAWLDDKRLMVETEKDNQILHLDTKKTEVFPFTPGDNTVFVSPDKKHLLLGYDTNDSVIISDLKGENRIEVKIEGSFNYYDTRWLSNKEVIFKTETYIDTKNKTHYGSIYVVNTEGKVTTKIKKEVAVSPVKIGNLLIYTVRIPFSGVHQAIN
jgi:hypothetical protein